MTTCKSELKRMAVLNPLDIAMKLHEAEVRIEELEIENAALQAKIDSLMLEYCPDEMTVEQIIKWAIHQVVSGEIKSAP